MKKLIPLSLALLLLIVMAAGCAGQVAPSVSPEPTQQSSAPSASKTNSVEATKAPLSGEITFWHSFTQGARFDSINKSAKDFMALHPGVKITIEAFSWGDFYTKWTTGLASGNVPDMSSALPMQVVEMIDVDALVPLNDLIDSIGRNRFAESSLSEGTVDKKNYSIPLYSHAQVMWYRKDLLDAAGLKIPQTWDELYETAKALTKNGIYGCSFPCGTGDFMGARYLNYYVKSCGEKLLKDDKKANLTSQAAIDGIKYWVKVYHDCSPTDSVNYKVLDQATLYYKGVTAFDFNSGFQIPGVIANSPKLADYIDCTYLPRVHANDPVYGAETANIPLVVWKNSKHPEICKEFIKFLFEEDRYIDFLGAVPVGMLPSLKDINTNKKYLANETVQKYSHAAQVIAEMIELGTSIGMENGPCVESGLLTSQNVIEEMFQDIITNGTKVETAAAAAEKKLNELFDAVK